MPGDRLQVANPVRARPCEGPGSTWWGRPDASAESLCDCKRVLVEVHLNDLAVTDAEVHRDVGGERPTSRGDFLPEPPDYDRVVAVDKNLLDLDLRLFLVEVAPHGREVVANLGLGAATAYPGERRGAGHVPVDLVGEAVLDGGDILCADALEEPLNGFKSAHVVLLPEWGPLPP